MDLQNVFVQQTRVAAFVAQSLSTVTNLALAEDVDIRLTTPFQQRLLWDNFVRDYKDRPLFCRHLRMSYDSFGTVLYLNVSGKI